LCAALLFPVLALADPAPETGRVAAIRNFFLRHRSPLAAKADVFHRVAERHKLDWRLLPSLSMVESSGGKHASRNNVFGWDSGRASFRNVEAGIEFVGDRLANSKIYSGRSTQQKLRRYNPDFNVYPCKVIKFMKQLSAEPID